MKKIGDFLLSEAEIDITTVPNYIQEVFIMLPEGFMTEELYQAAKTGSNNALNMYCKLESMNYQQLLTEARGIRKLLAAKKHGRAPEEPRRILN